MPESHTKLIGNTPLRQIDGVWVKLECSNPGGSIKDRVAEFMLSRAIERGDLVPGDTVVEATSGNTGIAMSMVARSLGYRVIIFMPENMSIERQELMHVLGAKVRLTDRAGGFELPVVKCDEYKNRPGYFIPDQFANPDNTLCHRLTTGQEIVRQLREHDGVTPQAFVAGVGTGGTLMGIGTALREEFPNVRIVAVEPTEAAVMSGEYHEHGIQGIGDGFIPDLVDMDFIDEVAVIPTADAVTETHRIASEHGFCVGVSADANTLAALEQSRNRQPVVTLWPDCSDRYGSVGLSQPDDNQITCPLKSSCMDRVARLFGDSASADRGDEDARL